MREVNERLKLPNLHIDHVAIRSELKYLIGAKIVDLKWRVVRGKTGPYPMVRVFRVVQPVAMVRFQVEPEQEMTREFGPITITMLQYTIRISSRDLTQHHDNPLLIQPCHITRRRNTSNHFLIISNYTATTSQPSHAISVPINISALP